MSRFLIKNSEVRDQWTNIFKVLKKKLTKNPISLKNVIQELQRINDYLFK